MSKRYPTINMYETGQRIKAIMEKRGLSVKEVQEYLELVTPQSIYHWFKGRNMPTVDNLYALSELFQVSVDSLLCGNREFNKDSLENATPHRLILYYKKLNKMIAA